MEAFRSTRNYGATLYSLIVEVLAMAYSESTDGRIFFFRIARLFYLEAWESNSVRCGGGGGEHEIIYLSMIEVVRSLETKQ